MFFVFWYLLIWAVNGRTFIWKKKKENSTQIKKKIQNVKQRSNVASVCSHFTSQLFTISNVFITHIYSALVIKGCLWTKESVCVWQGEVCECWSLSCKFSPCSLEQYREEQMMLVETVTTHTHDRIIIITPQSAGCAGRCVSEWSVSRCWSSETQRYQWSIKWHSALFIIIIIINNKW